MKNNIQKTEQFDGQINKIVIESEVFKCFHPKSNLIKKQRLTMHMYDKASLTTYYFPSKSQNSKVMNRFRFKYTDKLMYYIAEHFRTPHTYKNESNKGTWTIELTNKDDEKWRFSGPLGVSLVVCSFNLSNLARRTLVLPNLLMFDGICSDLVYHSSTKKYNVYSDRKYATSTEKKIEVPILYVEEKGTNDYYICDSDFTEMYFYYLDRKRISESDIEELIFSYAKYY